MEKIKCPICDNYNHTLLFQSIDIKVNLKRFNIVRCENCGLIITNPRPTSSEIIEYYPQNYYSYIPPKINKNIKKTVDNKKFLDIGCGSGSQMIIKENEGFESFGVEISNVAVENGKKAGQNIEFYDGKKLPFDDALFDIVNMGNVIEHLHHINEILIEIKRVLKLDGYLTICAPNIDSFDAKLYGKYWRHLDVPRHLYHFSVHTIDKILSKNGFKIIQISTYNIPALSRVYLSGSYTTIKSIMQLNPKAIIRYAAIFLVLLNYIKYSFHKKSYGDGLMLQVSAKINQLNKNLK